GEEALFTRAAVSEDDRDWLVEHLTEGDEQLVTSQFDPPELPVVAIVDRQAELKQLIESDEADRRMASHALRLARLHTSTIGERPRIRLHVNLASPAVRAVLQARSGNPDGALRGIRLLRSVKHLVGRAGEAQGTDALPRALEDVCAAVVSLCEAG
ncbi:MAG TPA: molecular chaperone HtpG, partial [Candidatus Dormibacteraeota bacterium]|nr:molecular chaperone HtpG [Candidatus Dormibacteraeota bacterium]